MNIAVLGASFDPSHNGHLKVARNILKSKRINKIMLMPVNIHPFAKKLTKASHRLAMAKLLEEKLRTSSVHGKNIEVSDLELRKNSTSFSIDTLQALKQKFSKDKFYWIIGSDNLDKFTKWKDWQKIIKDFGLIVVARDTRSHLRGGVAPAAHLAGENRSKNIIILKAKDFAPLDISSSEIRKRVKEGKKIGNLVPKKVEEYIIQNNLYK